MIVTCMTADRYDLQQIGTIDYSRTSTQLKRLLVLFLNFSKASE